MTNPTGNLVLNGITDAELVKILEVKMRHEHSLNFNPQQMQVCPKPQQPGAVVHRPGQPQPQPQPVQLPEQVYNNVVLQWANERGLEAVKEIVHLLLKKEERMEKAAGQ